MIHWTMSIEDRATGWLDHHFHQGFRELMFHAADREDLLCPVYCLMPDHAHLVWMGMRKWSDQRNGMKFLREHINKLLAKSDNQELTFEATRRPSEGSRRFRLQKQAYDHILRERERERGAFGNVCAYILANPVRAGLAKEPPDWPFSGAIVPGYPTVHPIQGDFWELFWKIYVRQRDEEENDLGKQSKATN